MAAGHLDGAGLGLAWAIPFAGLLGSIALGPQLAPRFWHRHFGKVALFWSLVVLAFLSFREGGGVTSRALLATLLHEYVPFVSVIFALFTIAGGVLIRGRVGGTPGANAAALAAGTLLAGVVGTTAASMLLVRPMIRANRRRPRNAHVMIFFIFLVANAGGALSPVGPPLFLGLLRGVDFGWTAGHLLAPFVVCAGLTLAAFWALDAWLWRKEAADRTYGSEPLRVYGGRNLVLLAAAVGLVFASGVWRPGVEWSLFGVRLALQDALRDVGLSALAVLSWITTPRKLRIENAFSWEPLAEVVQLFAGIFVTMMPVLAMLQAGQAGVLAGVTALATAPDGTPRDAAYFWTAGLLSSVLDNAPTFLIFLDVAGGDVDRLMGPLARTLTAISAGAVFFGGLTYIGNAPNFMVRAIAKERGVRMPSFFGFVGWSAAVLLPVLVLTTLIFFR